MLAEIIDLTRTRHFFLRLCLGFMVSFKVFSPFVCNPVPLDVSFDKGGGLLSASVEHVSVSCFGYSRFLLVLLLHVKLEKLSMH